MIDALIFSKDRPAQLDLLLRSIRRHAPFLYRSLSVLYTPSSRDYQSGYQIVFSEHDQVTFILEHNFEKQTRQWIEDAGETISFLVDDDVFHREAPAAFEITGLLADAGVSLRGGDYDYPFSVDGNVYRNRDVAVLFAAPIYRFRNPNEFEHAGHLAARDRLPFREVLPSHPSCLVGVPLNRVSRSSGLDHMDVPTAWLNSLFLRGRRLTVPTINECLAAHAEIDLPFEESEMAADARTA